MAATALGHGYRHLRHRPAPADDAQVTLVLILLFGTSTLVLQDDRFIKWKPTVLYGAMSMARGGAVGVRPPRDAVGVASRTCPTPSGSA